MRSKSADVLNVNLKFGVNGNKQTAAGAAALPGLNSKTVADAVAQLSDNKQTQAKSSLCAVGSAAPLGERLQQILQVILGNARTRVVHLDEITVAAHPARQQHPTLAGVAQGVA